MKIRSSVVTTMTAGDATIGKCLLVAVNIRGSAAAEEVTALDGTAIKMYFQGAITAGGGQSFSSPIAFNNLVVDATGTGAYSVVYIPVP